MATTFYEIFQLPGVAIDEAMKTTRTRTFRGINQNPQTSTVQILDDFGNDRQIFRYSIYQGPDGRQDASVRAQAIAAEQQENMVEWIVRVTYTAMSAASAPGLSPREQRERAQLAHDFAPLQGAIQPPADPTEWAPRLRITGQDYEESLLEDAIDPNKPVQNGLYERPVPPPTRTRSFRVFILEINAPFFAEQFLHNFENTVNNAVWRGYAARTVLCKRIEAANDYRSGRAFWKVTYTFWVKKEGWQYKLLHQSLNYRTAPWGEAGSIVAFRDEKTGEPLNTPRPIRRDGTKLDPRAEFLHYDYFNEFPERDFALLGLGV